MSKLILLALLLLTAADASFGQSKLKRNDIYLEAGGNSLFGGINYEHQITKEAGLGLRVGIGFYTENAFYLALPIGINYLFPLKNKTSFIDAGLGITWARIDGKIFKAAYNTHGDHFTNFIPSIGYRKHTKNNTMWRVSLTPVANKFTLTPWIGLSVGKRF